MSARRFRALTVLLLGIMFYAGVSPQHARSSGLPGKVLTIAGGAASNSPTGTIIDSDPFGKAAAPQAAATDIPPLEMSVTVDISLNDPVAILQLKKCLLNSLRKIKELTVWTSNENQKTEYILEVLVVKNESKTNILFGYAASILVTSPLDMDFINSNMRAWHVDDNIIKFMDSVMQANARVDNHAVNVSPNINELCRTVSTSFELEVVEPMRQLWQRMRKP
jgi:hypothetical protein